MVNIEKTKENIKCPQFGDLEYGEWGALRLEQRIAYKELIEEIERLQEELDKTRLSELDKEYRISKAREYIKESRLGADIDESESYFIKDELLEILDKEKE